MPIAKQPVKAGGNLGRHPLRSGDPAMSCPSVAIVVKDFSPSVFYPPIRTEILDSISKRHLARQFPRFIRRWRATAGSACQRTAKVRPKNRQNGFLRHPAFSLLGHAAFGEAALPPALLENERLRVFGDTFQQLDVATVAGVAVAPNAIRLRILLTADEQDKHR
ncbi:MAG: hypothetical protein WEB53_04470 [Akkermansiaceae bacterium]